MANAYRSSSPNSSHSPRKKRLMLILRLIRPRQSQPWWAVAGAGRATGQPIGRNIFSSAAGARRFENIPPDRLTRRAGRSRTGATIRTSNKVVVVVRWGWRHDRRRLLRWGRLEEPGDDGLGDVTQVARWRDGSGALRTRSVNHSGKTEAYWAIRDHNGSQEGSTAEREAVLGALRR
jgi:hypothetical protein